MAIFNSENLPLLRERAGLSVEQFAQEIGCTREDVRDMEAGTIRASVITLGRIIAVLRCDVADLVDDEDWSMADDPRESDLGKHVDDWIEAEHAGLPELSEERSRRISAVLFPSKLA